MAACLAVIAGVSLSMPDTVSRIEMGTSSGFETAATMLGGSTALGYIVVGLLAFVLGVCVTVLCFRIRRLNEEEQTGEHKGENAECFNFFPFLSFFHFPHLLCILPEAFLHRKCNFLCKKVTGITQVTKI